MAALKDRWSFARANADMVGRAIRGAGPDSNAVDKGAGARMVVNIAGAHIPAICKATADSDPVPYKNTYDREPHRYGDAIPDAARIKRERVDRSLPVHGSYKQIYFGAVELNGSGIRFYGDFCMVLNAKAVPAETMILNRNSYDLVRPPLWKKNMSAAALRKMAATLAGRWFADLPKMASKKVLGAIGARDRRLTAGQISRTVLDDEDYIEVLKIGSFGIGDLQDVRVSASDAAAELNVGERLRRGPTPSAAELIWRQQRKDAVTALAKHDVRVRIVTTDGRVKP